MAKETDRAVRGHNERLKAEIRLKEAVEEADAGQSGLLARFRSLNDTGQRLVLGLFVVAFIFSAWWGSRPRVVYQKPPDTIKMESAKLVEKSKGLFMVEGAIRNTSGQRVKKVVFEASLKDAQMGQVATYIVAHDLAAGQVFSFSLPLMAARPQSELQVKPFSIEY